MGKCYRASDLVRGLKFHHLRSCLIFVTTTSSADITQIILSTAHPAKFSEAVTRALGGSAGFDFDRDVLPEEFKGLLKRQRRVINVDSVTVEEVKKVIEDKVPKECLDG